MSIFSEDDRKANLKNGAGRRALEQELKRQMPKVAADLVELLVTSAREAFRSGCEVTEVRAYDGALYPEAESSPNVPEELLKEVVTSLVEIRFGRKRSEFQIQVFQTSDNLKPAVNLQLDIYQTQNTVRVVFDKALQ